MPNTEADMEAYKQANDDHRHYGVLRFTILGAFVTISSGLFVFVEKDPVQHHKIFLALALFTTVCALMFSVIEWRINKVSIFYAKKIDDLAEQLGMSSTAVGAPEKSIFGDYLVPSIMFVIYGGSAIMWLYACFVLKSS